MPGPRRFSEYAERYEHVRMARTDGVIELTLHSGGAPLIWGDGPHTELSYCFEDVGSDRENRVVILTGTGDDFIRRLDDSWRGPMSPDKWDKIFFHGRRLLARLLDIPVPVIGAVNGPARVHAELAVLSDVVLAAETADFQDAPHFRYGTVPGDGVHAIWPLLLGMNRGRYFLLTGQRISAAEAYRLGVVSEVVASGSVLARAREIAAELVRQPDTTLRYTRLAMTEVLRKLLAETVGYGLALEGLGAYASWPAGEG